MILALCVSGCFQQQGLKPLDLTAPTGQVDAKTSQTEHLYDVIQGDLSEFDALYGDFSGVAQHTWSDSFPLDLFRHAAMACATQALGAQAEPESPEAVSATELGLACEVVPLPALQTALNASREKETALTGLRAIDALREKRTLLEGRLRALPRDTNDMREYVASQRSESRRVDQELERRKPEYNDSDFATSKKRVREWQAKLDALEAAVERLDTSRAEWQTALETRMATLYRQISLLGTQR